MRFFQHLRAEAENESRPARRMIACANVSNMVDSVNSLGNTVIPEVRPELQAHLDASVDSRRQSLAANYQNKLRDRGCEAQFEFVQKESGIIATATCAAIDCPLKQQ